MLRYWEFGGNIAHRIWKLSGGLVLVLATTVTVFGENWPGYEKDNRHQNSSATDIDPAQLGFALEHIFSNQVDC